MGITSSSSNQKRCEGAASTSISTRDLSSRRIIRSACASRISERMVFDDLTYLRDKGKPASDVEPAVEPCECFTSTISAGQATADSKARLKALSSYPWSFYPTYLRGRGAAWLYRRPETCVISGGLAL
jgi:hypothetical protein